MAFIRGERNENKVTDVKVDLGGGDIILSEHFSDAGDDSYPLDTDYALTTSIPRTGGNAVVGYLDPINEPKAQVGDKRIVGRDPNTKLVVVEVWLKSSGDALIENQNCSFLAKADGSIQGTNSNGSFKLEVGGNFVVNNVVIDQAGNITTPEKLSAKEVEADTSLVIDSKEIKDHNHPAGTPPGNTGPNN